MQPISLIDLIQENIYLASEKITSDEIVVSIQTLLQEVHTLDTEVLVSENTQILRKIAYHYDNLTQLIFGIGLKLDDEERFEEAIFHYRLSLALQPNPKAYNNLAVIYASEEKEEDAIRILKEGLVYFPEDEDLLENYAALTEETN